MDKLKETLLIDFFDSCYQAGLSVRDMLDFGESYRSYVIVDFPPKVDIEEKIIIQSNRRSKLWGDEHLARNTSCKRSNKLLKKGSVSNPNYGLTSQRKDISI